LLHTLLEHTSVSNSLAPGIPGTRIGPAASSGVSGLDELLAALPDRIEPVRRSWAFRLRLALAVLTLLTVLVVYVALVVITSYGVWSHFASKELVAAVHEVFVESGPYAAFCVAGPILCLFLVKPLFTGRWAERPGVTLDRSIEPRLFAYVERLCAAQGAPAPRRIRVDTEINASASLRHGLLSLFRDDLVLTVGLPLAQAMTLRELTGVLAHEFGHFAHGGAMRLSYLIRLAIISLLRIAHERDGFDEILLELSRFRVFLDLRVTVALWLFALFMFGVQAFLWLARALMKGMAWVGLVASGALLREMEYDADRHEARVAGGEAFDAVGDKLAVLGAARQAAASLQQRWWQSRRLVDDLPALVVTMAERLAARPEVVQEIRQKELETTTGRLDTHPALRDRLASVARDAEPGTITLDAPASALFSDLAELCRAATRAEYHDMLGFMMKSALVVPVAELLYEVEGDRGAAERIARFTQGCPLAACRVTLGPPEAAAPDVPTQPEEAVQSLESARRRVLELSPSALDAARRLEETRQRHTRLDLATIVIRSNGRLGASTADLEIALDAKRKAAIEVHAAESALVPFTEALNDRLRTALQLRQAPHVANALRELPGAADPARCETLAATLAGLDAVRPDLVRLRSRLALMHGLFQRAASEPGFHQITRSASEIGDEVRKLLKTLREALDAVPYPFPTADRAADPERDARPLGAQLGSVSTLLDPASVYNRGIEFLSQISSLEERIVSSLVGTAEQVESALGLPPLPDPSPQPQEPAAAQDSAQNIITDSSINSNNLPE
jgi:Zn-dependent protease with chaperone function